VSRRLALGGLVALAGGAVAGLAAGGTAAAQTATTGAPDSATTTTEAPPSTTAPPKRPTSTDVPLLGFAQSLELAAVQLYDQALPSVAEDLRPVLAVFRRHHQAYAEQLDGLLGRRAPNVPNETLVEERTPAFGARTADGALRAAYNLEIDLAASYTELLRTLRGTDGVALIASIQPIEARQAVVIGQATDVSDEDLMPLLEGQEPGATVLTPTDYPIVA
jgi:hypothetical protein